jgi:hypothetical protein
MASFVEQELADLLAVDKWTIDRWRKKFIDFPQPIWITGTMPRPERDCRGRGYWACDVLPCLHRPKSDQPSNGMLHIRKEGCDRRHIAL